MKPILRPLAAALALCLLGSLAACGEQAAEKLPDDELLDFSNFGDLPGLDYGDDGWFPPTELGLANTTWNYGSWMLELRDSGGASAYAGLAELSYQQEDGQEYQRVDFGAWRMEDDCLYLEFSADSGRFPVLIDPSGEHLRIQQDRDTKARLPFFADGADTMELTLSYG